MTGVVTTLSFILLQKFTLILLEHLHNCDSTNHSFNTAWYQSMCEGFQQLLLENHNELVRCAPALENSVFTADVDGRIIKLFTQFQALVS